MTKSEQDQPRKSEGVFIDMEDARKRLPEGIRQLAANIIEGRKKAQASAESSSEK